MTQYETGSGPKRSNGNGNSSGDAVKDEEVAVEEVVERVVVEGGASENCRSRAVCADCSSVLRCCG